MLTRNMHRQTDRVIPVYPSLEVGLEEIRRTKSFWTENVAHQRIQTQYQWIHSLVFYQLWRRNVVGSVSRSKIYQSWGSNSMKGSLTFYAQETLPLLLSTGCFQVGFQSDLTNKMKLTKGLMVDSHLCQKAPLLNIVKTKNQIHSVYAQAFNY